ncbi:hypothetical protein CTAYLR_006777 [Chrysophaeum taylorii]|uniref:Uncharacterized protein n=1 Tax=Chrysophaeum taylorii TaxID=2483200 RepID=A0AAD7U6N5_9STRA|nr:hypothetical protein CTAYLR_006777 [Chrysophaeum taylorii]
MLLVLGTVAAFQFAERVESAKTAVVAGLATSVGAAPFELAVHVGNLPQFEFNVDQLAIMGALFGVVYRYAVRDDTNPQLNSGVVGAFALTRSLASVRVSPGCAFAPLACGPPFGYLDLAMAWQLASTLATSAIAFYAAAAAIDAAVDRGFLQRYRG